MTRTVAIETLGCKVNQYESSYLLERLHEAGYELVSFSEPADLYIVHSCAVTSKASYQTRQLLRRAQRLNPAAKVAVLGCDAQAEGDLIERDGIATHILGSTEKFDLLDWLQVPASFSLPCRVVGNPRESSHFRPLPIKSMLAGRARAFLKVQDGCDAFCSYCVVPLTRGKSRSLEPAEVISQMRCLIKQGYSEIVLTGIHLGQWGKDLHPPQSLANLLKLIGESAPPAGLRLSSLEPMEWTPELIAQVQESPWICRHFHVPLQSGDEEVLTAMRRPYTPTQYRELINTLHDSFPDAAIGADIMVGFPGESSQNFRHTLNLVEELPLAYLHVFPFSPRPGTVASQLPGRVTGDELKRRARALQDVSRQKRIAYSQRFLGQSILVLPEQEIEPGYWRGTSPNYLKITFRTSGQMSPGVPVNVKLTRVTDQTLWGTLSGVT